MISDDLSSVPSLETVDYVIHLASVASPVFYRKYPMETFRVNTIGTQRLLSFYQNRSLKGFLYFSSSEVYGSPDAAHIPTAETYIGAVHTIGPRACYDEGKRYCETLCYLSHLTYGMPIRIVRPFNHYGPGMKRGDGRVPADFADAVLSGKDICIYSDGTPTRSFCYIADAICAYLKVLCWNEFDIFNIGSEECVSVSELALRYRKIGREYFRYDGAIVYQKSSEDNYLVHNPQNRCPDITKARNLLNYDPGIGLNDGILRYMRYLQDLSIS